MWRQVERYTSGCQLLWGTPFLYLTLWIAKERVNDCVWCVYDTTTPFIDQSIGVCEPNKSVGIFNMNTNRYGTSRKAQNKQRERGRDEMWWPISFHLPSRWTCTYQTVVRYAGLCFVAVSFLFVGFFERKGVTSVEISVLSHHKEIRKKEQVVPVGHHLSMTQRNAGNE